MKIEYCRIGLRRFWAPLTSLLAQRIEDVIAELPPSEMRGFFYGVFRIRNMTDACMGMLA
jgi:hypothetical protein